MDQKTAAKHWFDGADDAWKTALILAKSDRRHHALFFLHLTIEKILKGLYLLKFDEPAPFEHNLKKLAFKIGGLVNEEELKELSEISSFNISARYDEYKLHLYEIATEEFTKLWFKKGETLRNKFLREKEKYG